MGFLFFGTLYAGYLGWQWKRTRELGDEIRDLKKALPAAGPDGVRPPSPNDSVIASKENVSGHAPWVAYHWRASHRYYLRSVPASPHTGVQYC